MRPLAASELVPLEPYAALRDAYRRRVIEYKRARRLAVGPQVSLVFEDRETLRFQVQEMLFVERTARPAQVQHELDVYNELMPGPRELSATLFIELTEPGRIRAELDRLLGLDAHVALVLGEGPGERLARARFDARQLEEDRISAVHYLRFPLSDADAAALAEPGVRARIRIDHPHYAAEAELPAAVRASLAATLRGEAPALLPEAPPAQAAPRDALELETKRVRVLRVGGSAEHWVVEPREPRSLLDADPELLAELASALQHAASRLAARGGACTVEAVVAAGGAPTRFHLSVRR